MSPRFVIYVLAFLTFVAVIEGCDKKSTKPKSNQGRKSREAEAPITFGESGFGLLLRPRNTKEDPKDTQVKELFRRIDTNSDDRIDAAEWVDFSKKTSVWDFVDLYSYTDENDDEAVSLEELLSVEIVEIGSSDEIQENVDVTSS
ncbi:hypothetical protein HOLleu_40429 [Holothuria leucospilota]|uniref:EF-hand domain-containing protein n=1 Tax=Holothuria leucospilota TaxID=206669 RepID=A0A9Q1BAH9_HOLLE|nr:hypothetical protein HOLleu_40429 [Holothuria leucospilota]